MSLVTLQRSPESSEFEFDLRQNNNNHNHNNSNEDECDSFHTPATPTINESLSPIHISNLPRCYSVKKNHLLIHKKHEQLIENYFVVKDAALILPKRVKSSSSSTTIISISSSASDDNQVSTIINNAGDILIHLQGMVSVIRPQDTITLAVKLSSYVTDRIRYLVIVETMGKIDKEESAIIGFDLKLSKPQLSTSSMDASLSKQQQQQEMPSCTIGLVLPIDSNSDIILDGDGGIKFQSHNSVHLFKPVSIQAMWSAYQYLHKALDLACKYCFYPNGMNHDWLAYYTQINLKSDQALINEWNQKEERSAQREDFTTPYFDCLKLCGNSEADERICTIIKEKLKDIMISFKDDYGSMNSLSIRQMLESELGQDLDNFKKFIDGIIFQYYNQLVERASLIDEHLYLGTEWNASDYDGLMQVKVTHILNVSREVDNFFADSYKYLNIRVLDVDDADLLKEFDRTYKFINEAKEQSSACLVHCKMGVSRSASIVIAYLMKEKSLNLDQAFQYVKNKRSCINPNKGFMSQLTTYESILNAHRSKYNLFYESSSTFPSQTTKSNEDLLLDENYPAQGLVKEAINRIKAKSSSADLNSTSVAAPPSSPLITDDNQINYYTENTLRKTQSSIRRCQSMKFRESPKLDIKRTPSQNENSHMQRVNFTLGGECHSETLGDEKNASQTNLENFVPIGIVKRQVESINFKSRPCTPEEDVNQNVDNDSDQNYYSSSSSSSSYIPHSTSPPRAQNSPDSKRCKIDLSKEETAKTSASLTSTHRSNSKKVFEFLADKLKETTNNANSDTPICINDNNQLQFECDTTIASSRRQKRETSKYHPLTILANKN